MRLLLSCWLKGPILSEGTTRGRIDFQGIHIIIAGVNSLQALKLETSLCSLLGGLLQRSFHNMAIGMSEPKSNKTHLKAISLCDLISAEISHYLCCVLSLDTSHSRGAAYHGDSTHLSAYLLHHSRLLSKPTNNTAMEARTYMCILKVFRTDQLALLINCSDHVITMLLRSCRRLQIVLKRKRQLFGVWIASPILSFYLLPSIYGLTESLILSTTSLMTLLLTKNFTFFPLEHVYSREVPTAGLTSLIKSFNTRRWSCGMMDNPTERLVWKEMRKYTDVVLMFQVS